MTRGAWIWVWDPCSKLSVQLIRITTDQYISDVVNLRSFLYCLPTKFYDWWFYEAKYWTIWIFKLFLLKKPKYWWFTVTWIGFKVRNNIIFGLKEFSFYNFLHFRPCRAKKWNCFSWNVFFECYFFRITVVPRYLR